MCNLKIIKMQQKKGALVYSRLQVGHCIMDDIQF